MNDYDETTQTIKIGETRWGRPARDENGRPFVVVMESMSGGDVDRAEAGTVDAYVTYAVRPEVRAAWLAHDQQVLRGLLREVFATGADEVVVNFDTCGSPS